MVEKEDAANDAIGDAKRVSEIGPVKALLTPSAELLGQRLRDNVASWLNKKSQENIERHFSGANIRESLENLSDQAQLDLFRWAESASTISPDEAELSAAIRAALRSTLDGKRDESAILIGLTREEILFLCEERKKEVDYDFAFKALESKGLAKKAAFVEKFGVPAGRLGAFPFVVFLLIATSVAVLYTDFGSGVNSETGKLSTRLLGEPAFQIMIGITFLGSIAVLWLPLYHSLTRKGERIRALLLEHLNKV